MEFAAGGALRRLLVLDGLQDPGNVASPFLPTATASRQPHTYACIHSYTHSPRMAVDYKRRLVRAAELLAVSTPSFATVSRRGGLWVEQGTLLRTALALGWQGVYCLPGCCDLFNDKALKAARGAAFRLPYSVGSWEELSAVASFHDMICLAAAVPTNGASLHLSIMPDHLYVLPLRNVYNVFIVSQAISSLSLLNSCLIPYCSQCPEGTSPHVSLNVQGSQVSRLSVHAHVRWQSA